MFILSLVLEHWLNLVILISLNYLNIFFLHRKSVSLLALDIIGIIQVVGGLINVVFPMDRVGQLALTLFWSPKCRKIVINIAMHQILIKSIKPMLVKRIELGIELLQHFFIGGHESWLFKDNTQILCVHRFILSVVFLTGLVWSWTLLFPCSSNQEFYYLLFCFLEVNNFLPYGFIETVKDLSFLWAKFGYKLINVFFFRWGWLKE